MTSQRGGASWEALAGRIKLFGIHAALYRLLGGRLMGKHVLILTTTGRKTLQPRSTPLFYVRDVIASNGGDDRYPGWWHNIRADPRVEIQVGAHLLACRADELGSAETARLWPQLAAVYGGYARYRAQTKRALTMFRLRPAGIHATPRS